MIEGTSQINFSNECPEIFAKIKKVFNVKWEKVIITYGNTIYSEKIFPSDVLAHEEVHVKQQETMGKDVWWDKYLNDKKFRLDQEVEAYRVQVKWLKENSPRNYKQIRLKQITQDLSGGIYG